MEAFAIVVVHCGFNRALELCLRQARKTNPAARVFWLGDDADGAERAKEVGVEFRSLDEPALSDGIAEFKSIYLGRSKNRPRLTEFCCKRWIYVRNLMRAENLRSCLALDSDVLLFCDAAEEAKRFQDFAGTFTRWDAAPRYTPHCNFIGSLDGLEEFCDFLFEVYRNTALFQELERKLAKVRWGKTPKRVWISDMSLWGAWSLRTNRKIAVFDDYYPQGVWVDGKINDASYFKTRNFLPGVVKPWRKIVDFRDGRPWGETKDGKRGPFLALHYQGGFKFLMEDHFEGRHSDWAIFKRLLVDKTKSVPQRIAHFTRRYLIAPLTKRG